MAKHDLVRREDAHEAWERLRKKFSDRQQDEERDDIGIIGNYLAPPADRGDAIAPTRTEGGARATHPK